MTRPLLLLLLIAAGSLTTPSVTAAQIYVARDDNGTLILSDKPLGPGAVTYAVPRAAAAVRTTRSLPMRARDYDELIVSHAESFSVRPDLVRAVIAVESGFNAAARSPKGAMGLMQLMPATARDLGVDRPYDPDQNIRGGVAYLRALLDRYADDEELALAAYNAGPGAVDKYGRAIPPYRETRDYVKKVKDRTDVSVGTGRPHRGAQRVYRIVETIDGREVTRYTNVRPKTDVEFEVVGGR